MYVVCLLFYAIGGNIVLFSFVLIGQDWPIDCSIFYVSERDDLCHFLLITEFNQ